METDGLQRLSATHNKTLNNDEANGCARRVHFTKFIMEIFEYYPFNCDNAVQVGPLKSKHLHSFVGAYFFVGRTIRGRGKTFYVGL